MTNQPKEVLSVGNVVSAGLRIYRDNFKLYYRLAFQAYLWILWIIIAIPILIFFNNPRFLWMLLIITFIYGLGKYLTILGLISRLAFSQVNEKPETESEAKSHVKPHLWTFLITGLLIGLIFFGVILATIFISGIIFFILASIIGDNPAGIIILTLLGIICFIGFSFGFIWFFSRLSLSPLFIAIEDIGNANQAIKRSWQLTKGYVWRLQLIFFVAFLVSIPINLLIQRLNNIFEKILFINSGNLTLSIIIALLNFALTIAISALLIPFWESIKAVIYYDLRSRKEGMGLNLRDS